MDFTEVQAAFERIWGYPDFRPPQGEIVRTLLAQRDALIVMPTGGGKSICFQLPALLQTGLTLVISPLVALMENQVQELRQKKLPAALLHGELPPFERRRTLQAIEEQKLRLLYLSPETLLSPPVWQRLSHPDIQIQGLILDEAHCLVQWGDTFRPTYRRLGSVRPSLLHSKPAGTKIAIAAFTATADPQAQQTIRQTLQLDNPEQFLLNPYRPNLHLSVKIAWTPKGRKQQLLNFIQAHRQQSGLVYVRTRQDSETLAQWLAAQSLKTAAYHAGLDPDARRQIEQAWLKDRLQFVVCTSAFGMGINKPDVRWVIHFHAPLLLSEYVQEVGRAGRDGKPAEALTLISEPTGWLDSEDKQRRAFFVDRMRSQLDKAQALAHKLPPTGEINPIKKQFKDSELCLSLLHSRGQLTWIDPFHYQILTHSQATKLPDTNNQAIQHMTQYLHERHCRWQFLLKNFGFASQKTSSPCGQCDNCTRR